MTNNSNPNNFTESRRTTVKAMQLQIDSEVIIQDHENNKFMQRTRLSGMKMHRFNETISTNNAQQLKIKLVPGEWGAI